MQNIINNQILTAAAETAAADNKKDELQKFNKMLDIFYYESAANQY